MFPIAFGIQTWTSPRLTSNCCSRCVRCISESSLMMISVERCVCKYIWKNIAPSKAFIEYIYAALRFADTGFS